MKESFSKFVLLSVLFFVQTTVFSQTFYQPPYHPAYYGGNGYVAPAYYKPAYVAPYHPYTAPYTPSYTAPSYKSSYTSYSSPSYKSGTSSYSSGSYSPSYSSSSSAGNEVTYASDEDFDNMITYYKEHKDYKTAAAYADKISGSQLSPENKKVLNDWKVFSYFMSDQTDKITSMFDAGTATVNNPENYVYVGYSYHVKKQYRNAVKYYEKANVLTSASVDKDYIFDAGLANFKIDNFDKAIIYFKKYLEKGGGDSSAYFFLGNSTFRQFYKNKGPQNSLDDAIGYYSTLIKNLEGANSTNRADVYQSRGQAKFFKKDFAGAIKDCDIQIKYNPDEVFAYELKAECMGRMKNIKGALDVIDKAMKMVPDNADVYNTRAYLKGIGGNAGSALTDINKAIELKGNDGNIYDTKGYILMKLDRYGEALAAFDKAIELDTEPSGGTYYFRGITKVKLRDKTGACEDLNKAKDLKIFMHSLITDADVQKAITANCK